MAPSASAHRIQITGADHELGQGHTFFLVKDSYKQLLVSISQHIKQETAHKQNQAYHT